MFVGTVASAEDSDFVVNVVVESVWKGKVGERVQVQGDTYRVFDVGTRYVFFPWRRDGKVFEDGLCSSTRHWKPHLERHAPPGAAAVEASPARGQTEQTADEGGLADAPAEAEAQSQASNLRRLWITAAVALAVIAGIVLITRRRAETP